jgi:hypothetical protein
VDLRPLGQQEGGAAEHHAPPLCALAGPDLARKTPTPDKDVLFPFDAEALTDGRLAR